MEAYFAFIVHPQSGDVLTDNNNRLPTVLHGDPAFDLNKLCTSVQNVINDVYSLILLRTECEVLAGRAHQDQSTVIPKYVNKLLIFEIVSEDLVSAPKGFTWLPKEKCSSVVVDPKVLSVCEFTKKYETLGLLVNWDRLHPFSRPGWFEEVASWIRTRAFFHNLCINDIQQASRRDNGCVLRATSSCGSVLYFKQVGPNVFFDEVRNSMLLSTFMSNYFTRPIEVDTDRKWILRKDQGTPFSVASCSMKTNPDLFQRVLRKWGTIQQQSIPLTDKLVESGMDLMDSAKLHVAMEELVSDAGWCSVLAEELASAGDAVGLDYVKANKLLLAQTRRLWDRAAMYNIPMALVHGDLSPANVMIDEGDEDVSVKVIRCIGIHATCFPSCHQLLFLTCRNMWLYRATQDDWQSPGAELRFNGSHLDPRHVLRNMLRMARMHYRGGLGKFSTPPKFGAGNKCHIADMRAGPDRTDQGREGDLERPLAQLEPLQLRSARCVVIVISQVATVGRVIVSSKVLFLRLSNCGSSLASVLWHLFAIGVGFRVKMAFVTFIAPSALPSQYRGHHIPGTNRALPHVTATRRRRARMTVADRSSAPAQAKDTLRVDVLVIGTGISGSSLSFNLHKYHPDLKVLTTEARSVVGGNVISRKENGYIWEEGPNTFQPSEAIMRLAVDVGLKDDLVLADSTLPRFVYWDDKLFALPLGPQDIPTFRLLSVAGAIRAGLGALGFVLPAPRGEESVKDFITRHLGREVYEKMIDPFVSGVYAGDASKLSMQSAFKKIFALTKLGGTQGILEGGIIRVGEKKRERERKPPAAELPTWKGGALGSFREGLGMLPDAIQRQLGDKIQMGWRLVEVERAEDGLYRGVFETGEGRREVLTRAIAMTTPAGVAASALKGLAPGVEALNEVYYPTVWSVTLGYPKWAFKEPLRGFGNLIPRKLGIRTLGTIWSSVLFPGRAPDDMELLLSYIGGAQDEGIKEMDEAEVVRAVHADVKRILLKTEATVEPVVVGARRWARAIPQYNVGHEKVVGRALEAVRQHEGVFLGGNYVHGVAFGDCVVWGSESAGRIADSGSEQ
ncbi:unnamed protein product [Agarophyton chilense]